MTTELLRPPTILVCNDLDGMMFGTKRFTRDVTNVLSADKKQDIERGIEELRRSIGSSATLNMVELLSEEMNKVNTNINQDDYLYSDVERYLLARHCGEFVLKHIILTHGDRAWQKVKTSRTILESLPMEVRKTNDKIDFIGSMLDKQNTYRYQSKYMPEEYAASWCFLVDDKQRSFKDGLSSFYEAEQLPNFTGFLMQRNGEYNHNKGETVPEFIKPIATLDQVTNHVRNMAID